MTAARRVLVTGTTSGLGRGFLEHYAAAGARVVAVNRRVDRDSAARHPGVRFEVLDIADPKAVEDLLRRLEAEGDAPDLFVLNAGINQPDNLGGLDFGAYHEVMRTNLDGVMTFVGAIASLGLGGRTIVGISSTSNIVANPAHVGYHVSKVAIRKAFALLGRNDPRNTYKSVVLGPVRTNIMARYAAPAGLQAKVLAAMLVDVAPAVAACARFIAGRRAVFYYPRWVCLTYIAMKVVLGALPGLYRGTVRSDRAGGPEMAPRPPALGRAPAEPGRASTAPGLPAQPSFTVVVPALNEEDNLRAAVEAVLREIGPLARELEVLVFDDMSTDRTAAVADALAAEDPRVVAIHNPRRLNIGGIYKAGVARARGDYVFLVPGDNETRVDEIARGLRHLGRADVVVFYVTNPGVRARSRRWLSRLYVLAVNVLFGTRFRYTNGTNVFRTEVVRRIPIGTNGFSYQTEALVKAVGAGVDFVEVGVELQRREAGTSKAVTWRNLKSVAVALGALAWDVRVAQRGHYRRRGRSLGVF